MAEPESAAPQSSPTPEEADDDEYPGFPADVCPEEMPDIAKHHSVMADVLKRSPDLYSKLRARRTRSGVGLAKCIKTGIDNRGHPMIKMLGLVAGDGECYEEFRELFDAVIENRFGVGSAASTNTVDFSPEKLTPTRADDSGKYVLSTQIRVARNLKGLPFPPAMNVQQLKDVERALATAFSELRGPLQGDYVPMEEAESEACPEEVAEQLESLRRLNFLFECPDSTVALCSGYGRHWPHGRGVFVNDLQDFSIWVNEAEHLRAMVMRPGDAAQHGFTELARALDCIRESLARDCSVATGFEYSDRLGFLTSCPSNLGTALRISFVVLLPLLMEKGGVSQWCAQRKVILRNSLDSSGAQLAGMVEVSNAERLGCSEVDTVNAVIEAVAELVRAEQRLEAGEAGLEAAPLPQAAQPATAPGNDARPAAGPATELDPAEHGASASRLTPAESASSEACDRTGVAWDVAGDTLGLIFAGAISTEEVGDASPNPEARTGALPAPQRLSAGSEQDLVTKLPSAEAAAVSTSAGLETLRDKVFVALTDAADNGTLDEILANARTMSAAADGGDASAGVASAGSPPGQAPPDIDDLRRMARDLLFRSAEDGSLNRAFSPLHLDTQEEQGHEETRARMRGLLESSLRDGTLEGALAELPMPGQERGEDMDNLRSRMRSLLEGAVEDGSLEQVLDSQMDHARVRTKDALEDALQDGSLEEVSANRPADSGDLAYGEQGTALDDVRDRMCHMLEQALDAGNLEDLLRKSPEPTGEVPSLAGGALEQACDDEEPPIEQTRSLMRDILELSLEDGSLDKVTEEIATESQAVRRLQQGQEAARAASSSGPADMEQLRRVVRGHLEASLEDGSLEKVTQEVASESEALRKYTKQLGETESVPQEQQSPVKSMGDSSPATTLVPAGSLTLGNLCERDCMETSRQNGSVLGPGLNGSLVMTSPWALSAPPVVRDLAQEFSAALTSERSGARSSSGSASGEVLAKLMLSRGIRAPALAEALLQCDRKIGALTVAVHEAQRQLAERDRQSAHMEAEIQAAKEEAKLLAEQIEQRRAAFDEAEAFNMQLRESRRQLSHGLDEELLKQRKMGIDMESTMHTARSDLSTACGLSDVGTPPQQQATHAPKQVPGAAPHAGLNAIAAA